MKYSDLQDIDDIRQSIADGGPASADTARDLLRIVDDLRQTISEVCGERDALLAWKKAVPVEALRMYWRNSEWVPADESDCTGDEARAASQIIMDWWAGVPQ